MKNSVKTLLAMLMTISLAACGSKTASNDDQKQEETKEAATDTTEEEKASEPEAEPETEAEPQKLEWEGETVQNGMIISGVPAEDSGWIIDDAATADWRVTYVCTESEEYKAGKYGQAPSLQITTSEDSVEQLIKSVKEVKDDNEEEYTEDTVVINGDEWQEIYPKLGMPALYREIDGTTVIVTFNKGTEAYFEDEFVQKLFASFHIAQ